MLWTNMERFNNILSLIKKEQYDYDFLGIHYVFDFSDAAYNDNTQKFHKLKIIQHSSKNIVFPMLPFSLIEVHDKGKQLMSVDSGEYHIHYLFRGIFYYILYDMMQYPQIAECNQLMPQYALPFIDILVFYSHISDHKDDLNTVASYLFERESLITCIENTDIDLLQNLSSKCNTIQVYDDQECICVYSNLLDGFMSKNHETAILAYMNKKDINTLHISPGADTIRNNHSKIKLLESLINM